MISGWAKLIFGVVGALALLAGVLGIFLSGGANEGASSAQPTVEAHSMTSEVGSAQENVIEASRTGEPPAGVAPCDGAQNGVAVGRGTDVTSCEFAIAVRSAYVAQDPEGGIVTLTVRSPVTDKEYMMTCDGIGVTRCTGGNRAVVVLY